MLWISEIHINLKIDADALNRRRRRFCGRCTKYHIDQGQWRHYAGKCASVYGICIVKNKIENETNFTDRIYNLI
jgi:ribosomal protein S27AE